ncbi:hypothetical protein Tco_0903387 [Tanacetum coccineum]
MSAMANSTPVITTVRNTDEREKTPRETDTASQARAAPESEATSVMSKSLTARLTPLKGLGTQIAPVMMATMGV